MMLILIGVFILMAVFLFRSDTFLDKSVVFSFDKSGYLRHQKNFIQFNENNLKDKAVLVTGGTSGIGGEVANSLTKYGAYVLATGRNMAKGQAFENSHPRATFLSMDMSDLKAIRSFVEQCTELDAIVLNAGSMPEKMVVNHMGIEHQCASQLLGHFYLIKLLKENGKLSPGCRIVWVSSGGMYLKKLDLNSLFYNDQYEKVAAYANVKRAQVTLVEELAKQDEWKEYNLFSMHPGWVDTEGLKGALPAFYKFMKNRLRDEKMGADTIIWLLMTDESLKSGAFYFDRKIVSPVISKSFNPNYEQRGVLLNQINKYLDF